MNLSRKGRAEMPKACRSEQKCNCPCSYSSAKDLKGQCHEKSKAFYHKRCCNLRLSDFPLYINFVFRTDKTELASTRRPFWYAQMSVRVKPNMLHYFNNPLSPSCHHFGPRHSAAMVCVTSRARKVVTCNGVMAMGL